MDRAMASEHCLSDRWRRTMLDKDILERLGRRLGTAMPLQPDAPLPGDLLRLVRELEKREEGSRPVRQEPLALAA
jgi:hypothetical protein